MGNLVLFIVIAFLVLMGFVGYKKGFVRIVLSMVAVVISMILTSILTPPVSKIIKETTPLYDAIYKEMDKYVADKLDWDAMDSSTKAVQEKAIGGLPLPESIKSVLIENNTKDAIKKAGSFNEYITDSLTTVLITSITYIGLFALIYMGVKIAIVFADLITKLPGVNSVNRSFGFVIGVVQGILIIWIACLILTALGGTKFGVQAFEIINENAVLSFIYNSNFIVPVTTSILHKI